MHLFDTHAHLTDEQIAPDLDDHLVVAGQSGLTGIVTIGTDLTSSRQCVELAGCRSGGPQVSDPPKKFSAAHAQTPLVGVSPKIYAAVGVHPNHCHEAGEGDWDLICKLARDPAVVAIGETGLDRYWDDSPIELQREWLARHIELSFDLAKPLVIHMRDCESDILDMFEQHQRDGKISGIMHSFAGSWETAQRCLDWGMMISFAGMVTFKKSDELREIAARIPDDRLLIETDSPYLTPHPHRGKRPNHPAMVRFTAVCLAEVRGVSMEAMAELTTQNAEQIFGIENKTNLGDTPPE